jgi:hypothetical protein
MIHFISEYVTLVNYMAVMNSTCEIHGGYAYIIKHPQKDRP